MLHRILVVPVLALGTAVAAALPLLQMHASESVPAPGPAVAKVTADSFVTAPRAAPEIVVADAPRLDAFGSPAPRSAAPAARVAVEADGRTAGWVTPDADAVARHRAAQAAAAEEAKRTERRSDGPEIRISRPGGSSSARVSPDRRGRERAGRMRSITSEIRSAMSQRFSEPFDFLQAWQRERRDLRRHDRRDR